MTTAPQPAARTCGAQDCTRSVNKPGQPLCYAHYQELRQGSINPCPNHPRVYKPAKFAICRDCNRSNTAASATKPPPTAANKPPPAPKDPSRGWNRSPEAATPFSPADPAEEAVRQVRRNMTAHAKVCVNHESNTIQFRIMPLLKGLGWHEHDPGQVIREYQPRGKNRYGRSIAVDVALLQDNQPLAFIEAKRLDREYTPEYEQQTGKYAAFLKDGGIAALTNGRYWLVYLIEQGQMKHTQTIDIAQGATTEAARLMFQNFGKTAAPAAPGAVKRPPDPPAPTKPQPTPVAVAKPQPVPATARPIPVDRSPATPDYTLANAVNATAEKIGAGAGSIFRTLKSLTTPPENAADMQDQTGKIHSLTKDLLLQQLTGYSYRTPRYPDGCHLPAHAIETLAASQPMSWEHLRRTRILPSEILESRGQEILDIVAYCRARAAEIVKGKYDSSLNPPTLKLGQSDQELIAVSLKEYRQKTATLNRQPPYTILKDETIDLLAQSQPHTQEHLSRIRGIGPATLSTHGQAILDIIRSARQQAARNC